MLQVTADGYGDYKKNSNLIQGEDWQEYSFRAKNPFTGKYTPWFSYKDNPLGMVLANIGYMSDGVRYKEMEKESLRNLAGYGLAQSIWFVKEQNYLQGIVEIANSLSETSGDKFDKSIKFLGSQMARIPRTLTVPNLYSQVYKNYKAFTGKPDVKPTRMADDVFLGSFESYINNVPFIEDFNTKEKFDQLGFPIIQKQNIPFTPDALAEMLGHRVEKHKEWELILGKKCTIEYADPHSTDKLELTSQDKFDIQKKVTLFLRKEINENFDKYKEYKTEKLQEILHDKVLEQTGREIYELEKAELEKTRKK